MGPVPSNGSNLGLSGDLMMANLSCYLSHRKEQTVLGPRPKSQEKLVEGGERKGV